jgi:hypothetical protein
VQSTAQGVGYHNANNTMDSFVNETTDAFTNLVTTTASDCQMLADLTTANKELAAHLATKYNEITQLRANKLKYWLSFNGYLSRTIVAQVDSQGTLAVLGDGHAH